MRCTLAPRHAVGQNGGTVPFHLMETVGGANSIRGFREYRFRDTRNLFLNVEYRWEVWNYVDFAFFYDAGKVFSDADDLDFNNLELGVWIRHTGTRSGRDGPAVRFCSEQRRVHSAHRWGTELLTRSEVDGMMKRLVLVVGLVAVFGMLVAPEAQQRKFYPDDPLLIDNDTGDVPDKPADIDLSDMFDRFGHIMADLGSTELTEAQNINTLDEVPNSSWFTNRHGVRRMSIAELTRGPDTIRGPDMSTPWRVFRSKIGGLTPGFQIIDGRGDRYVIKFDPVGIPELSSSAEVISTKLFYAIGYNVPENYIVAVDPEAGLAIEPGTVMEDEFGDETPLTRSFLRRQASTRAPPARWPHTCHRQPVYLRPTARAVSVLRHAGRRPE